MDGFRQMVRMVRFDQDAIRNDLHNINLSGIKHLSNLRSQVCRSAILFFEELFTHLGRSMEMVRTYILTYKYWRILVYAGGLNIDSSEFI